MITSKYLNSLASNRNASANISTFSVGEHDDTFLPSLESSIKETYFEEYISLPENTLTCPISLDLLEQAVVANDGHTYTLSRINEWLKSQHDLRSPMTRARLDPSLFVKSNFLERRLQGFKVNQNTISVYLTDFLCPHSGLLFNTPVLASDGNHYEKSMIEKFFQKETAKHRNKKLPAPFIHSCLLTDVIFNNIMQAWLTTKPNSLMVYARNAIRANHVQIISDLINRKLITISKNDSLIQLAKKEKKPQILSILIEAIPVSDNFIEGLQLCLPAPENELFEEQIAAPKTLMHHLKKLNAHAYEGIQKEPIIAEIFAKGLLIEELNQFDWRDPITLQLLKQRPIIDALRRCILNASSINCISPYCMSLIITNQKRMELFTTGIYKEEDIIYLSDELIPYIESTSIYEALKTWKIKPAILVKIARIFSVQELTLIPFIDNFNFTKPLKILNENFSLKYWIKKYPPSINYINQINNPLLLDLLQIDFVQEDLASFPFSFSILEPATIHTISFLSIPEYWQHCRKYHLFNQACQLNWDNPIAVNIFMDEKWVNKIAENKLKITFVNQLLHAEHAQFYIYPEITGNIANFAKILILIKETHLKLLHNPILRDLFVKNRLNVNLLNKINIENPNTIKTIYIPGCFQYLISQPDSIQIINNITQPISNPKLISLLHTPIIKDLFETKIFNNDSLQKTQIIMEFVNKNPQLYSNKFNLLLESFLIKEISDNLTEENLFIELIKLEEDILRNYELIILLVQKKITLDFLKKLNEHIRYKYTDKPASRIRQANTQTSSLMHHQMLRQQYLNFVTQLLIKHQDIQQKLIKINIDKNKDFCGYFFQLTDQDEVWLKNEMFRQIFITYQIKIEIARKIYREANKDMNDAEKIKTIVNRLMHNESLAHAFIDDLINLPIIICTENIHEKLITLLRLNAPIVKALLTRISTEKSLEKWESIGKLTIKVTNFLLLNSHFGLFKLIMEDKINIDDLNQMVSSKFNASTRLSLAKNPAILLLINKKILDISLFKQPLNPVIFAFFSSERLIKLIESKTNFLNPLIIIFNCIYVINCEMIKQLLKIYLAAGSDWSFNSIKIALEQNLLIKMEASNFFNNIQPNDFFVEGIPNLFDFKKSLEQLIALKNSYKFFAARKLYETVDEITNVSDFIVRLCSNHSMNELRKDETEFFAYLKDIYFGLKISFYLIPLRYYQLQNASFFSLTTTESIQKRLNEIINPESYGKLWALPLSKRGTNSEASLNHINNFFKGYEKDRLNDPSLVTAKNMQGLIEKHFANLPAEREFENLSKLLNENENNIFNADENNNNNIFNADENILSINLI